MKLKSINPKNSELLEQWEELTNKEVFMLVDKVAQYFKIWRKTSFKTRSNYMHNAAKILLERKQKLAQLITNEMGKPISESIAEIEKCAWVCKYYANTAERHLAAEIIESDALLSKVTYEPLGTILGIMPWNFPFWQVFRFLAPTLMAGNTALLKHASNVQGCALQIEQVFSDAGFPAYVFKTLVIGAAKVEPLIKNERVKAVTLTGSEWAGSMVASQAGSQIKKTVLELGGSNAFIVLNDAPVEKAVEIGIAARMMNAGQSCIAAKRFIIQRKIADEFIELFIQKTKTIKVGDPLDNETRLGPLSSQKQAEEVEQQVNRSLEMGAKMHVGGKRDGAFYYPTVLTDISRDMPVFCDEVFGPVAPIVVFDDIDEAIQLANASKFGLGISIITGDTKLAEDLVPQFEDGAVFINSLVKSDPRLPFGGTKFSGYGRELSRHGILEFVNAKTVYIQKI